MSSYVNDTRSYSSDGLWPKQPSQFMHLREVSNAVYICLWNKDWITVVLRVITLCQEYRSSKTNSRKLQSSITYTCF